MAGCLAVLPSLGQAAEGGKKAKEWYLGKGEWKKTTEPQPIPDTLAKVTGDAIKGMLDSNKKVMLIDTRNAAEYKDGHLPKAVNLYDTDLKSKKAKLPKDKATEMIFYCNGYPSCPRSLNASKMAMEQGYKNISIYPEGFPDWQAKGYPIEH